MTTPARRRRRARVESIPPDVDRTTAAVLRRWTRAYNLTARDLERAVLEAAEAGPLSRADFRAGRLRASLDAMAEQIRGAALDSGAIVNGAVPAVIGGSAEVTASYTFAQAATSAGAAGISVNLPDPARLERLVRRTTERVASAYIVLSRDAERSLRDELLRGASRGAGPRDVARRIVDNTRGVFGGGITRALNLARTEMVDASRYATTETYVANPGLVTGWRWSSALDRRTCPACWAMHNTLHAPDEILEGHQQCRCTQSPVLAGDDGNDDLGDPAVAFRRLPREQQQAIMGPSRLAALDDGLPFRDLVQRRNNPGWRPGHYVRPVRDLEAPRVDFAAPVTALPDVQRGPVLPGPAIPADVQAPALSRAQVATRLAADSDVDPGDLVALRDELQAVRTAEWLRAVDETGADLDLDPWLEDVLDVDALEPPAREWVARNPQPSLGEYARAARERARALEADLPDVTDVDEWADAWGAAEDALPNTAKAGTGRLSPAEVTAAYRQYLDDLPDGAPALSRDAFRRRLKGPSTSLRRAEEEYGSYRHQIFLEAEAATGGNYARRGAPAGFADRVELWLQRGGRMPSARWMSEELQAFLKVGEYGNSRSDPFLSLSEFRRQRDARPDVDDAPPTPALPPLPPPVQAALERARATPGRYLDDTDDGVALLRETYTTDLPGGYSSTVTRLTGAQVRGSILDPDGKVVGEFRRTFERDRRTGALRVRHDSLKIDERHQGRGLASALNARAEGFYRAKDVEAITTYASSDGRNMVGGYVWARAGFDWGDPEDVALFSRLLRDPPYGDDDAVRLAERMAGDREGWPTPFEVSQTPSGKRLLLSEPWEAIRWLT